MFFIEVTFSNKTDKAFKDALRLVKILHVQDSKIQDWFWHFLEKYHSRELISVHQIKYQFTVVEHFI